MWVERLVVPSLGALNHNIFESTTPIYCFLLNSSPINIIWIIYTLVCHQLEESSLILHKLEYTTFWLQHRILFLLLLNSAHIIGDHLYLAITSPSPRGVITQLCGCFFGNKNINRHMAPHCSSTWDDSYLGSGGFVIPCFCL